MASLQTCRAEPDGGASAGVQLLAGVPGACGGIARVLLGACRRRLDSLLDRAVGAVASLGASRFAAALQDRRFRLSLACVADHADRKAARSLAGKSAVSERAHGLRRGDRVVSRRFRSTLGPRRRSPAGRAGAGLGPRALVVNILGGAVVAVAVFAAVHRARGAALANRRADAKSAER